MKVGVADSCIESFRINSFPIQAQKSTSDDSDCVIISTLTWVLGCGKEALYWTTCMGKNTMHDPSQGSPTERVPPPEMSWKVVENVSGGKHFLSQTISQDSHHSNIKLALLVFTVIQQITVCIAITSKQAWIRKAGRRPPKAREMSKVWKNSSQWRPGNLPA